MDARDDGIVPVKELYAKINVSKFLLPLFPMVDGIVPDKSLANNCKNWRRGQDFPPYSLGIVPNNPGFLLIETYCMFDK